MDVQIKTIPELRTAAVHHVGPYQAISEAFRKLGEIAGRSALFTQVTAPTMLAVFHDDPETTPADQLRSDAALVVPSDVSLPAGLAELRVPGGDYASTVFVGPYEQLGDAWRRLMGEWLPASGKRLAPGVSYEVYLNNPQTTPKAELRTELRMPIAAS